MNSISITPTTINHTINPALPVVNPAAAAVAPTTTTTTTKTNNSPPPPVVEDQAGEGGQSIETFASYKPTALPKNVVDLLNGSKELIQNPPPPQQEVISLIDDDDDDDDDEDEDDDDDTLSFIDEDDAEHDEHSQRNVMMEPLTCPSHTSLASESALLASVRAPLVDPKAAECLLELAKSKALSPLQFEGVLLAIQRHHRIFSQTTRAGFFIGDGAGVGKGRQIAAIIRDSFCRQDHTRRHVWLSVSRELVHDAKRDLTDVGVHVDVHDGSNLFEKNNGLGIPNKGVFFCTYALLVTNKRMEQIVSWCAGTDPTVKKAQIPYLEQQFNGCIIFDEAHKAKNLQQDSKTAKLVIELQRRLPKARVVYVSATGVSDISHMCYAERLGLWATTSNETHSLFESFPMFQRALESRGLGSLEMLALEMKQQGSFMARTLSWEGCEFSTMEVPLDLSQKYVYDQAVFWWMQLKHAVGHALSFPIMRDYPPNKMIWRVFWSAHQRFFKELAICSKIPYLATDALKLAEEGHQIIFGLQGTGEAAMESLLEQVKYYPGMKFSSPMSTCKAIMSNFLLKHFPIRPGKPEPPKLGDPPGPSASVEEIQRYFILQRQAEMIKNMPPPEPIPDLVNIQMDLMNKIKEINLPPNPLDDLIDRLGGVDNVSEMTGRPGRIVRLNRLKSHFLYMKRANDSSEDANDRVNLVEKRKFMDGKKTFAIISDAASTGISLHAARGSGAAHKRRVHYTIELPWSADKAVQQLGRSHRSAQESAPIYKLVVTDLGGERRFAAAVSKRMASLGALTKGDRRAATGSDMLSAFDLDSKYGTKALRRFYDALSRAIPLTNSELADYITIVMPSRGSEEILNKFSGDRERANDPFILALPRDEKLRRSLILSSLSKDLDNIGLTNDIRKTGTVKVFLNRLFGLACETQKLVFTLFMSTLEDIVSEAKLTGEFDGSAEEIKATSMEISDEQVLTIDPSCGAETKLTTLLLDRGISFETVCEMATAEALPKKRKEDAWMSTAKVGKPVHNLAESGFYISRNKIAGRHLILFAQGKFKTSSFENEDEAANFDPLGLMVITRPNTGTNPTDMPTKDLNLKYRLALSCDRLQELVDAKDDTSTSLQEIIRTENKFVESYWERAFEESNHFEHANGLAPRRSKLGLVTGAVLHVLPMLEKAVQLRSTKDRALKIMRAEVDSRKLVGVRFPADDEAMKQLKVEMDKLNQEQKRSGKAFHDETISPVCAKSTEWATAERKTMKSFFKVVSKNTPKRSKRIAPPSPHKPQKKVVSKNVATTTSISSFFQKKSI